MNERVLTLTDFKEHHQKKLPLFLVRYITFDIPRIYRLKFKKEPFEHYVYGFGNVDSYIIKFFNSLFKEYTVQIFKRLGCKDWDNRWERFGNSLHYKGEKVLQPYFLTEQEARLWVDDMMKYDKSKVERRIRKLQADIKNMKNVILNTNDGRLKDSINARIPNFLETLDKMERINNMSGKDIKIED